MESDDYTDIWYNWFELCVVENSSLELQELFVIWSWCM